MIGPGSNVRVLICTTPVDFRPGIDGLVALVQNEFGRDSYAGGMAYAFRAKRKDRCKVLITSLQARRSEKPWSAISFSTGA